MDNNKRKRNNNNYIANKKVCTNEEVYTDTILLKTHDYNTGLYYYKKENYDKAFTYLSKAITEDNKYLIASMLYKSYFILEFNKTSLNILCEIARYGIKTAYKYIGKTYEKQGNYKKAVTYYWMSFYYNRYTFATYSLGCNLIKSNNEYNINRGIELLESTNIYTEHYNNQIVIMFSVYICRF
jgi:tetratricopeptide (TPR) repeat protein